MPGHPVEQCSDSGSNVARTAVVPTTLQDSHLNNTRTGETFRGRQDGRFNNVGTAVPTAHQGTRPNNTQERIPGINETGVAHQAKGNAPQRSGPASRPQETTLMQTKGARLNSTVRPQRTEPCTYMDEHAQPEQKNSVPHPGGEQEGQPAADERAQVLSLSLAAKKTTPPVVFEGRQVAFEPYTWTNDEFAPASPKSIPMASSVARSFHAVTAIPYHIYTKTHGHNTGTAPTKLRVLQRAITNHHIGPQHVALARRPFTSPHYKIKNTTNPLPSVALLPISRIAEQSHFPYVHI